MCVGVTEGDIGDRCDLASTLCKYDLKKGDLFVLGWVRVRRGSLSSELLMCGGGVRSILLLPLVGRCLETIDVCIWRMFVFMSVVVTMGMFVVSRPFLKIVGFEPWNVEYVAMGSAVLFILRSRLLVYSAGSRLNRVQVVLSGFSVRLLYFVQVKLYVGMAVYLSLLHSCLCV